MPTEIKRICLGAKTSILKCKGRVNTSDFFTSWSIFSDGKTQYCKDCCDQIFDYYISQGYTPKSALYYVLQKIDIPFISEVDEKALDRNKIKKMVSIKLYIQELQRNVAKKHLWNNFSDTDVDIKEMDLPINQKTITADDVKTRLDNWGIQESIEDYNFLDETFNKYTKDIQIINQGQEDKYRDLCRDRLLLRKINDKRYDGAETLDTVQKRIDRQMESLKINEFDSNTAHSLSEKSLINLITQVNENNVEDIYKDTDKYYDYTKLRAYNKDCTLRPLANMLLNQRDFNINLDDLNRYNV